MHFSRAASGETVDATQELYTLGICNVIGSFVSSMPVTGSFSRSAVNHASGVRTPIGGLYTGKCTEKTRNKYFPNFTYSIYVMFFSRSRNSHPVGVEFTNAVLLLHSESFVSRCHNLRGNFYDRIRSGETDVEIDE